MCIRDRVGSGFRSGVRGAPSSRGSPIRIHRRTALNRISLTCSSPQKPGGSCPFRRVPDNGIMDVTPHASVDEFFHDVVQDALEAVRLPVTEPTEWYLSLIHISEPTRLLSISYAVFC